MKVTTIKNNQYLINNGNEYIFQSYDSIICKVDFDNNIIVFGRDWEYSNTTMKYLKRFLEFIGLDSLSGANNVRKAIYNGCYNDTYNSYKVIFDNNLN